MVRETVKKILKSKGMTQGDLAVKLGSTQDTVSRQLSGNPTLKTLTDISNALEVSIKDLFPREEASTPYGFIEYEERVYKISSFSDLEELIKMSKGNV